MDYVESHLFSILTNAKYDQLLPATAVVFGFCRLTNRIVCTQRFLCLVFPRELQGVFHEKIRLK